MKKYLLIVCLLGNTFSFIGQGMAIPCICDFNNPKKQTAGCDPNTPKVPSQNYSVVLPSRALALEI
jgi:hypothetical protein